MFPIVILSSQMRPEVEYVEYEAPRSVSPTPPVSPQRSMSTQLGQQGAGLASSHGSSGNLSTGAAPTATPVFTPASAPVPVPAAVSTPAPASPAPQQTYAAPAPVVTPQPAAHVSVNLLDWDEPTPTPVPMAQQPSRSIALIECAGRFTPVLFQQLWGRLQEAYAGQVCTLSRRPGATSELEAALRTQKVPHHPCFTIIVIDCQ